MSRALDSAYPAALSSQIIYPALFVQLQFQNETLYLWSGVGSFSWNGFTWTGVGNLGSVSPITESSGVEANGITLTLSGIDATLLPECLTQLSTSGIAKVYLGLFTGAGSTTPTLLGQPYPIFVGLMDSPAIDIGTETATITLSVENRLSDLNRARGGLLTDQDQRARHQNDNSLLYVSLLQDMYVNWQS